MSNTIKQLAIVLEHDTDVPPEATVPSVYRFDRRRCDRHEIGGCVTAVRVDHDLRAYRRPICSLRLRNQSDGGIGAISDVPFEADERISVYFTSHGVDGGVELHGHVVRCKPLTGEHNQDEDLPVTGYEIGLRFDPCAAA